MLKARIYVFDCGQFVKIGVSQSPDKREKQIPYQVGRYYATEKIENPYKIESEIHKLLKDKNVKSANGTEYFNVDFDDACRTVNNQVGYPNTTYLTISQKIKLLKKLLFKMSNFSDSAYYGFFGYVEGVDYVNAENPKKRINEKISEINDYRVLNIIEKTINNLTNDKEGK